MRLLPHRCALALAAAMCAVAPCQAQDVYGPPKEPPSSATAADRVISTVLGSAQDGAFNPLEALDQTATMFQRDGGPAGEETEPARAGLSPAINFLVLLTVISLVPSIMLMTTCFVRIIVVLGLLKQALGTQQLPPPQVILGLALFMTLVVMAPTLDRINEEAVAPYRSGEIRDYDVLWDRAKAPLRDFMFDQIDAANNWQTVYMMLERRGVDTSDPSRLTRADVDMVSLIPAFMLSELKVSFVMGFKVYLPFLVIDMVIASLLISMSMMMLPPVLISLPFKLLLFVLVDGWQLVVGSLMSSFAQGEPGATALLYAVCGPGFA